MRDIFTEAVALLQICIKVENSVWRLVTMAIHCQDLLPVPWGKFLIFEEKKVIYLLKIVITRLFSKPNSYLGGPSQCPRTDLDKRSLPRPKTTTAWKLTPHSSKISKNWNPPHWDPHRLHHRFFKNWFLLIQKQLCNIQTHFA